VTANTHRLTHYHHQTHLEERESELLQLNSNRDMLRRNYNELTELKFVLEKDNEFFQSDNSAHDVDTDHNDDDAEVQFHSGYASGRLGFMTGAIETAKLATLERVLWRATRGNLYMRAAGIRQSIEDPKTVRYLPE
jgi:V-type H+-transporting ATPase subunit a